MKVPYALPMRVRSDVHLFAEMMENELLENYQKGGYEEGNPLAIIAKLCEEVGELGVSLLKFYAWDGAEYGPRYKSEIESAMKECADIGNVAMFMAKSLSEMYGAALTDKEDKDVR